MKKINFSHLKIKDGRWLGEFVSDIENFISETTSCDDDIELNNEQCHLIEIHPLFRYTKENNTIIKGYVFIGTLKSNRIFCKEEDYSDENPIDLNKWRI